MLSHLLPCSLLLLLASCASTSGPADARAPSDALPDAEEMEFDSPGPEHAALAPLVGAFQAEVHMNMGPGQPEDVSHGTYVVRWMGGMWLVGTFRSTFMGQPFEGVGILGYDQDKKEYTNVWFDTLVSSPQASHGTWNAAKQQLAMRGTPPGMPKDSMRDTTTVMPDGTIEMESFYPGEGGKEERAMRIVFTRQTELRSRF